MNLHLNGAMRTVSIAIFTLAAVGMGSAATVPPLVTTTASPSAFMGDAGALVFKDFKSHINGVNYELIISLPKDYTSSSKRYSALYLTDGRDRMRATNEIAKMLAAQGESPGLIIVGIDYPGRLVDDAGSPPVQRWADYPTPARSYWNVPSDRGAPVFLRVMTEEVIPYIEHTYRANPADRGIAGHSMGGFFAAYALFNTQDVFRKYWISSPSMVWDDQVLLREEAKYAASHQDLNATVFADVGELEDTTMVAALQTLADRVRSHDYLHLRWKTEVAHELPHTGTFMAMAPLALYNLYGDWSVQVDPARLRALQGNYRISDKEHFDLVCDDHNLFITNAAVGGLELNRLKLLASSPSIFFARYIGLRLTFRDSGSQKEQHEVSVSRHGRTVIATRVDPTKG